MQNRMKNEQYSFTQYLLSLKPDEDRGALAVMRRGLNGDPAEDLNLYRFVARYVPEYDRSTPRESIYYLLAALYALHPANTDKGNFGNTMSQVAHLRDDQEAAERRFTALLNTRLEDIAVPLRQAVTMVKQQEPPLPINWVTLFQDLLRWPNSRKTAQREWANAFWAYERPGDAAEPPSDQPQPELAQGE